jgi:hypothetical protein
MLSQQLREQLINEINAINSVFARHEILIKTVPGLTHVAGDAYVVYEIDTDQAPALSSLAFGITAGRA